MLDWTFERVLDLDAGNNGQTPFFRVFPTSIGVDSAGSLYVLDAGNYAVSVFDREGGYVRSISRRGTGPGELEFPSDMAVSPAGEVAVYDFARRALVLFDATGSYTGTFSLPGPLQRQVVLLEDGRIVAAVTQPAPVADSSDYRLLELGLDTVELVQVRQRSEPPLHRFSCISFPSWRYFTPRVVWAATANRVAATYAPFYSVRVYEQGHLAAIWRRDLPAIPSTLELAAWEVAQGDSLRVRNCVVERSVAAEQIGYADVAPAIKRMAITPEGGLWLRRQTDIPGYLPIDVFDATGAYVGTLPDDSPFPALFRGTEEIVAVEPDEFDVPHVVVYRFERGR